MGPSHRTLAVSIIAAAAAALLSAGAAAQEHPHPKTRAGPPGMEGHPDMMGGMGAHGMMGGHGMAAGPRGARLGHIPTAILHQAEALGLSDEQVSRVEALSDSVAAIHERAMEAMHEGHAGLGEAFTEGGIDVEVYRDALRATADRMVDTRVAAAEVAQSALQVLEPSQREKFLYALHLMHRMHGGGGSGHGMMHGEG